MPSVLPPAERRSVVMVATYVALALFLLVVGERLPTQPMRALGAFLFGPFDALVLSGRNAIASLRENSDLHARIVALELENQRLRMAGAENRELRSRLELPVWRLPVLHPVEVLGLSGEPTPVAVTISAGSQDGIAPGDALVAREGLVGRVVEVYGTSSRAALLTDPNLGIACEAETTGVRGILRFTLQPGPRLLLTSVPLADTVRVGEVIVTSNLSLRFPRGIPVGRVRALRTDPSGLMQDIEIEPAARIARLRHAFVVPGPGEPDVAAAEPVYRAMRTALATPAIAPERRDSARADSGRLVRAPRRAAGDTTRGRP